jgi:lysophospholipase L1-like esterase
MVTLKLADVVVGSVANTRERHLLRLVPGASLRHRSNEFDYVFRTNRLGLRGPDVAFAKPAGTFRIVVLGDSFVAGYGVPEEHLLTTLLQDRLAMERPADRKTAGSGFSRVEVVNVGRVGTSTIRELDLYEILGRRFEPDLVILAYYLGNDLAEANAEEPAGCFAIDGVRFAGEEDLANDLAQLERLRRRQRPTVGDDGLQLVEPRARDRHQLRPRCLAHFRIAIGKLFEPLANVAGFVTCCGLCGLCEGGGADQRNRDENNGHAIDHG